MKLRFLNIYFSLLITYLRIQNRGCLNLIINQLTKQNFLNLLGLCWLLSRFNIQQICCLVEQGCRWAPNLSLPSTKPHFWTYHCGKLILLQCIWTNWITFLVDKAHIFNVRDKFSVRWKIFFIDRLQRYSGACRREQIKHLLRHIDNDSVKHMIKKV